MNGFAEAPSATCNEYGHLNNTIDELRKEDGVLLNLRLADAVTGEVVDDNLYWLPNASGRYPILDHMPKASITATAEAENDTSVTVSVTAPQGGPVAFFNRIAIVDSVTKKRILPAFSDNNYISVLPGNKETIHISFTPQQGVTPMVCIEGWNVDRTYIPLKKHTR